MSFRIAVVHGSEETMLKLPPNIKASFNHTNALFDPDAAIIGSFHMGIKLPLEGNERALKFAHSIETESGEKIFDIKAFDQGGLLFEGKLLVEEAFTNGPNGFFDCSVIIDGYGTLIQDLSIRDVVDDQEDIGSTSSAIATAAKTINAGAYPTQRYCFPMIYNPKFYDESVSAFTGFINPYNQTLQKFFANSEAEQANYFYTLCPSVYMLHVLESCFTFFGYTVNGEEVFNNERLKKMIVYGAYALDRMYREENFEVETTSDQSMNTVTDQKIMWHQLNYDLMSAVTVTVPSDTLPLESLVIGFIRIKILVGEVTCSSFALKVNGGSTITSDIPEENSENWYGVVVSGSTLSITVTTTGGNVEILSGSTLYYEQYSEPFVNIWNGQFSLADCLPDKPIGEFLSVVKKLCGIQFFVDPVGKSVDLLFATSLRAATPESLSPISTEHVLTRQQQFRFRFSFSGKSFSPPAADFLGSWPSLSVAPPPFRNKYVFIQNVGSYFKGAEVWIEDFEWEKIESGSPDHVVGEGKEKHINLGFDLAKMSEEEYFDENEVTEMVLCPSEDHVGAGERLESSAEDWPFRILIYHGMHAGDIDDYPFASSFAYDKAGDNLTHTLSLVDSGNGIYELFWDGIEEAINAPRVEIKMRRSDLYLAPWRLLQKPIKIDGTVYLVADIDVTYEERDSLITILLTKLSPS